FADFEPRRNDHHAMTTPRDTSLDALVTRRSLFGKAASGIGIAALANLLQFDLGATPAQAAAAAPAVGAGALPGLPHVAPKAKRVVYLFQNGAPTHVDLFDYKT